MTDYYVIGDVHGKAGMLEDLLKTWDGQTQLLFLGDLIDRFDCSSLDGRRASGGSCQDVGR
ncbi:serine/threonine protein phosphatase [Streptococcus pneumoniae]|nr:serine/threonine protein phosphatase [Streptococcus pneumoniae]